MVHYLPAIINQQREGINTNFVSTKIIPGRITKKNIAANYSEFPNS